MALIDFSTWTISLSVYATLLLCIFNLLSCALFLLHLLHFLHLSCLNLSLLSHLLFLVGIYSFFFLHHLHFPFFFFFFFYSKLFLSSHFTVLSLTNFLFFPFLSLLQSSLSACFALQMGGDFILNPSGEVSMVYCSKLPHDRPSVDELLPNLKVINMSSVDS